MEAVHEQDLEDSVDDVRHDDDLEGPAQVRDAAQVALSSQRDQRGQQPDRRDPEIGQRIVARPPVGAEGSQERTGERLARDE